MRTYLLAGVIMALSALASPASAFNGYATGNVHMRVGPGTSYHKLTVIPRGAAIEIHGCLNGYRWCDVSYRGLRGWSYSRYVSHAQYRYQPEPYWTYAPRVRTPIIVFDQPRYYHRHYRHYRHQPWYHYGGIYNVPRHHFHRRHFYGHPYRHSRGGIYLGFGF